MSSAEYKEIVYEVNDPVAVITFNRPHALNAMTPRMQAEIRHALAEAETDNRVVGIVLTGEGKGFCAGMDMNALDSYEDGKLRQEDDLSVFEASPGDPTMGANFMISATYLLSIRKPIIAAINGPCAGLGFIYSLFSDIRIVERTAKITTAFAARGLIAEVGISWILPRLIGSGAALDLLWTARKFMGDEAKELGIAEKLVEQGEAKQAAIDYVKNLAATSAPKSIQLMKAQVYRHLNMQLADAMTETNQWMAESLVRPDFKEGVRSFIEKRPPEFSRVTVQ